MRLGFASAFGVIVSLGSASGAQDWSSCVQIGNDIARLACFDREAIGLEGPIERTAQLPEEDNSEFVNWEKREEQDPISDRRNVSYFGIPTEPQFSRFGTEKSIFLQLRCFDNTTSVVLYFDEFQRRDTVQVTVRNDDEAAREQNWGRSSNRKAAGKWEGATAIPFIRSLIGTTKLVMRARLDDGQETYVFDTRLADVYAADIAEACNWEL